MYQRDLSAIVTKITNVERRHLPKRLPYHMDMEIRHGGSVAWGVERDEDAAMDVWSHEGR